MRKPVIVGNWKMNMTVSEAEKLLDEIKDLDLDTEVEAGVCTPAIDLLVAKEKLAGTNVGFGGQICTSKKVEHSQEKYLQQC